MDVRLGGPPGHYAPAHYERYPGRPGDESGEGAVEEDHQDDGEQKPLPPLLRDPPGEQLDEYSKNR